MQQLHQVDNGFETEKKCHQPMSFVHLYLIAHELVAPASFFTDLVVSIYPVILSCRSIVMSETGNPE
jgi:hypothetical protein